MKLDVDCIRRILLFVEDENIIVEREDGGFENRDIELNVFFDYFKKFKGRYSHETITYSILMAKEANLIIAESFYADNCLCELSVSGLTYKGHEYLEKVRDPKVWKATKKFTASVRSYSIDLISETASKVILGLLDKRLPTLISSIS